MKEWIAVVLRMSSGSHTYLNPRGRGVPPERKSDRSPWVNRRERLPMLVLVREKLP